MANRKHYLVSNINNKNETYIVKESSVNEAILKVSQSYGYSVLHLNAYIIDELLENNEGLVTIKLS